MPCPARALLPLLVVPALLTACGAGGFPTGGNFVNLSSDQATSLATGLFADLIAAFRASAAGSRVADRAPGMPPALVLDLVSLAQRTHRSAAPTTQALTISHTCALGGTLTGTGTLIDSTDTSGTGPVSASMTVVPHGCQETINPQSLALNGDPDVRMILRVPLTNGQQSDTASSTVVGHVSWNGGTCTMAFTVREAPDHRGTISGGACAQNFTKFL